MQRHKQECTFKDQEACEYVEKERKVGEKYKKLCEDGHGDYCAVYGLGLVVIIGDIQVEYPLKPSRKDPQLEEALRFLTK